MALIKCPECGTEVSDRAEKCPKCAFPINPEKKDNQKEVITKTETVVKSQEGCFLQTLNLGCISTLVIGGLIVFFALFKSCS